MNIFEMSILGRMLESFESSQRGIGHTHRTEISNSIFSLDTVKPRVFRKPRFLFKYEYIGRKSALRTAS